MPARNVRAARYLRVVRWMLILLLVVGCRTTGPKQLKRGHLAYNESVRVATDHELLLNIVRLRYLDTIEFLTTNAISSQISYKLSGAANVGGIGGTALGGVGVSGSYSDTPTITFTPQRGHSFAEQIMRPSTLQQLVRLGAANWDMRRIFYLFVRNVNHVTNEMGRIDPEFHELTARIHELQTTRDIFFGNVPRPTEVGVPIPAERVSAADQLAAVEKDLSFRPGTEPGTLVLTRDELVPMIYVDPGADDGMAVRSVLELEEGAGPFYVLRHAADTASGDESYKVVNMTTRSLLNTLAYLTQGVEVPEEHTKAGITVEDWPPRGKAEGISADISSFFRVVYSVSEPDATLRVRYRGHWFYIAETDLASRHTFLLISELFRLQLSDQKSSGAPVLTLAVGGGG